MEAKTFYAWATDKIKYVEGVNEDLKMHLGLLELGHPALAIGI